MHAHFAGSSRRARLAAARLYLVLPSACASADAAAHDRTLVSVTRAAIAGGVDIVQLREKERAPSELVRVANELAGVCRELGALFFVNDAP